MAISSKTKHPTFTDMRLENIPLPLIKLAAQFEGSRFSCPTIDLIDSNEWYFSLDLTEEPDLRIVFRFFVTDGQCSEAQFMFNEVYAGSCTNFQPLQSLDILQTQFDQWRSQWFDETEILSD
jgi:hypothetical protein